MMNREIEFRGKQFDTGEWVYGYINYNQWHDKYYIDLGIFASTPQHVDPETIGQYTGLKDKNGVKIFDGDKYRCFHQLNKLVSGEYNIEGYTYGFVFYDSDKGCFRGKHEWCDDSLYEYFGDAGIYSTLPDSINNIEVIGNIHDQVNER